MKEAEKELPFKILSAYRHLSILEESGILWKDMGIPTIGGDQTISERVLQFLRDQEKVIDHLTQKYILERTFSKDETEKSLRDIYELHLKTPGMVLPRNEDVLKEAIREGVKNGLLGLRERNTIFFKQMVDPDLDSIALRGEIAEMIKKEQEKEKKEPETSEYPEEQVQELEKQVKEGIKREARAVRLKAVIPWDKLFDVLKGVIGPLKDKGSTPKIIIEIKAESEQGFDRMTLDSKVKETLKQIGAEMVDWEEK